MCSTQRWSTSSRKIEKAFLGRSDGSESCVTSKKNTHLNFFKKHKCSTVSAPLVNIGQKSLTLWHLSKAWRVSCNKLTTSSGERKVSPWVSMLGPSGRLVRCLIRSFRSWILLQKTKLKLCFFDQLIFSLCKIKCAKVWPASTHWPFLVILRVVVSLQNHGTSSAKVFSLHVNVTFQVWRKNALNQLGEERMLVWAQVELCELCG